MTSFGKRARGARLERMHASPQFRDGIFVNSGPVDPTLKQGTMPALTEFFFGGKRRTPEGALPVMDPRPTWATPADTGLRATWLGHSTVLLEIDGVRVLTDPVWGDRASPFGFAGPKRFAPAPVPIASLPPLDAIVISHDHYDHLDYPTILALAPLDVPIVTSLGVGAHLEAWGIPASRIVELDWWESVKLPRAELSLTAAPAQHFSGRGLSGRNGTLWSSFVLKGPRHTAFFSGDTGLTPTYAAIRERLGPFDLIMLEVGAFHPAWGDIHLGPDNALKAWRLLGGGALLPVHWGTFNLALHAWDEPAEVLLTEAHGVPLLMPKLGEAIQPARAGAVDPWWRAVATAQVAGEKAPRVGRLPPAPWPID
jgi:L-ascorbate metabolism protein UlaG (beta-lactamase superfamily)